MTFDPGVAGGMGGRGGGGISQVSSARPDGRFADLIFAVAKLDLKGQCHEMFYSRFFQDSSPHGALIYMLELICK